MGRPLASRTVDRVIVWSLDNPLTTPKKYLAATLLIVGTGVVRAALIQSILPWLMFSPVILSIALTMGRRPGFYAVILSALTAYLTIPDYQPVRPLAGPLWFASLLFIVVGGLLVVIGSELREAIRRLRQLLDEREQNAVELGRVNRLLTEKEAQAKLLAGELGHRLKNVLQIVQAIASQTLRQATDIPTAADALSFRLTALGRAADVLTASSWKSADMRTLALAALEGHSVRPGGVRLEGPPVRFNPQIALALTLALHELATNATKYGALSTERGHVDLSWSLDGDANDDDRHFALVWREFGGPVVKPPTRRGFGSLLIERSLRQHFPGTITSDYQPSGLVYTIDAPLTAAAVVSPP